MFQVRKSQERGFFNNGWLKSYHTFSFSEYYDPNFMGYGALRVINEDFVDPLNGFPNHGHREMEIITYPIQGVIEHKDSTGTSGIIHQYEIQKMTAGTGITHSEKNPHKNEILHLLQIWILPKESNLKPSYEQKSFKQEILSLRPTLLLSPLGEANSLKINQDLYLWAHKFSADQVWNIQSNTERKIWIQIVKGEILCLQNNSLLKTGDGLAISNESLITLTAQNEAEILLFDMA